MPICPTCGDELRVVRLESDNDKVTLLMPPSHAWRLLRDLAPHALDQFTWNLHCVKLGPLSALYVDKVRHFFERSRLLVSGRSITIPCPDCRRIQQQPHKAARVEPPT